MPTATKTAMTNPPISTGTLMLAAAAGELVVGPPLVSVSVPVGPSVVSEPLSVVAVALPMIPVVLTNVVKVVFLIVDVKALSRVEMVASGTMLVTPSDIMVVPEEIKKKEFVPVVTMVFSMVLVMRVVPEIAAEASEEIEAAAEDKEASPDEMESMAEEADPTTEVMEPWRPVGTGIVVSTSVVTTVVAPSITVVSGMATVTTLVVASMFVI